MKDNFSWLTPKQAGDLAEYSARHIQNMITSGKLSATKEDGKYYIDKSDFFRLFPKAHKKEQEGNVSHQRAESERLSLENSLLKESAIKKDSEIDFLRKQLDGMLQEKLRMLDVIVSNTRLLEHKKEGDPQERRPPNSLWKNIFRFSSN